jgi:hypothetical protein
MSRGELRSEIEHLFQLVAAVDAVEFANAA